MPRKDEPRRTPPRRAESKQPLLSSTSPIDPAPDIFSSPLSSTMPKVEAAHVESSVREISKLCDLCQRMLCNWKLRDDEDEDEDRSTEEQEDISMLRDGEKAEPLKEEPPCYLSPRQQRLIDLKRAALEEGCTLCYQFWNHLCDHHLYIYRESDRQIDDFFASEAELRYTKPTESVELEITFWETGYQRSGNKIIVSAYGIPATDKPLFKWKAKAPLNLAAHWLERCDKTHTECKDVYDKENVREFLPTRLILIQESNVQLCPTEGMPKTATYATLSHCWGSMPYLTLKRSNFEAFCEQVPPAALSNTISDAIKVARYMGFSYIWIDTLCIVQDSREDWRHEAALMCAVYSGSGLNIAASGAYDGSEGRFPQRPEQHRHRFDLQIKGLSHRYDLVSNNYVKDSLGASPLLRRGWAFQERLLAPRTLHFTKVEMFWECGQVTASENFPGGIPEGLVWPIFIYKQDVGSNQWPDIIDQYSICQLTYATDKLVAISGVARAVQQDSHDQYVAGMWRTNLERQLCWAVRWPDHGSTTDPYIAPTWSWASVNVPIKTMYSGDGRCMSNSTIHWLTVLDVKLKTIGEDVFGALISGSLHVSCGVLLDVELTVDEKMIFAGSKREISTEVDLDNWRSKRWYRAHDLVAMPVISCWHHSRYKVVGILLKTSSEQCGAYERVGLFSSSAKAVSYGQDDDNHQEAADRVVFEDAVAHATSLGRTNVKIEIV